jgi:hypothetical protein
MPFNEHISTLDMISLTGISSSIMIPYWLILVRHELAKPE